MRTRVCSLSLFGQVLGWLSNVVSRRFEFQADGFGVELGRGEQLRKALIILDKENKESCSASRGKAAFSSSFLPGQHAVVLLLGWSSKIVAQLATRVAHAVVTPA